MWGKVACPLLKNQDRGWKGHINLNKRMMLKKSVLVLCLLSLLLFAVGCATSRPLGQIPHDEQDFKLSMEELKTKYTEISVYERKGFFLGYRTPTHIL